MSIILNNRYLTLNRSRYMNAANAAVENLLNLNQN